MANNLTVKNKSLVDNFSQTHHSISTHTIKPKFKAIDQKAAARFKAVIKYNFEWIPALLKMPFGAISDKLHPEKGSIVSKIAKVVTISVLGSIGSVGVAIAILPFTPLFGVVGLINASVGAVTGKDLNNHLVINEGQIARVVHQAVLNKGDDSEDEYIVSHEQPSGINNNIGLVNEEKI